MREYVIENLMRPAYEARAAIVSLVGAITLINLPHEIISQEIGLITISAFLLNASRRGWDTYRLKKLHYCLGRNPPFSVSSSEITFDNEYFYVGNGFKWESAHTKRLHQYQNLTQKQKKAFSVSDDWVRYLEKTFHLEWTQKTEWEITIPKPKFKKHVEQLKNSKNEKEENKDKPLFQTTLVNPFSPAQNLGGKSELHGVGMFEGETPIWLDLIERSGHMLVLGTTGVGKTRFLELQVTQDIRRGNNVVIVFDPKGDADLIRRMYAEATRANRPIYIFHLAAPSLSARYNPVGDFERITEVAGRISGQMPSTGNSAAFKQFVWRYVNVITKAMAHLGDKTTYKSIYENANNPDALIERYFTRMLNQRLPDWRDEIDSFSMESLSLDKALKTRKIEAVRIWQFAQSKGIRDEISDALSAVMSNEKSYFDKLVSSLFPILEKLCTGKIADLLSPNYDDLEDDRPIFSWSDVINQRAIVYIGLDALTDREVSTIVGNSMLADLTSTAGKIYNRGVNEGQPESEDEEENNQPKEEDPFIQIHVDEFNELVGDEFAPLVNKSRGAKYQITVHTQTVDDLEAKMQNKAKSFQILGNFNTIVMLRVQYETTAQILTRRLPEVKIEDNIPISSSTGNDDPASPSDFSSQNYDRLSKERVPMLSFNDVVNLPKGQAFIFTQGNLYKVRLPMPTKEVDPYLPDNLSQLTKFLEKRYAAYQTRSTYY
jgi:conjugative coupling factor TraD (TOL family)